MRVRWGDERDAVSSSRQNRNRVCKGKAGRDEHKRGPERRVVQSKTEHVN